jgi:hypothetical protein
LIKQAALFRERIVVGEVRRMLKSMELHTAMGFPGETDAITILAARGEQDLEVALVRCVMDLLGATPSAPKDSRFDKNHRAVNAARLKGPKGGDGYEL